MIKTFNEPFKVLKPIIGMIHVDALPGTARYAGNISAIIDKAIAEALVYREVGLDTLAIENMQTGINKLIFVSIMVQIPINGVILLIKD